MGDFNQLCLDNGTHIHRCDVLFVLAASSQELSASDELKARKEQWIQAMSQPWLEHRHKLHSDSFTSTIRFLGAYETEDIQALLEKAAEKAASQLQ